MNSPPAQLGGAKVLCWADVRSGARPTGKTVHRANGAVLPPAAALAICQYDGDAQFYLFYCNGDWNVRTDTCHSSLESAKEQAEFKYEGISSLWRAAT